MSTWAAQSYCSMQTILVFKANQSNYHCDHSNPNCLWCVCLRCPLWWSTRTSRCCRWRWCKCCKFYHRWWKGTRRGKPFRPYSNQFCSLELNPVPQSCWSGRERRSPGWVSLLPARLLIFSGKKFFDFKRSYLCRLVSANADTTGYFSCLEGQLLGLYHKFCQLVFYQCGAPPTQSVFELSTLEKKSVIFQF